MWYVSFYPWVILDIVEESLDKVADNKACSTCHKDCNTTLFPTACCKGNNMNKASQGQWLASRHGVHINRR